jgi:hypothetical protein
MMSYSNSALALISSSDKIYIKIIINAYWPYINSSIYLAQWEFHMILLASFKFFHVDFYDVSVPLSFHQDFNVHMQDVHSCRESLLLSGLFDCFLNKILRKLKILSLEQESTNIF